MPQYLIDTGDCPITVEDIRIAVGLDTDQFDGLIASEIEHACIGAMMRRPPRPIRRETWMVDADNVDVFGVPCKVGPVEHYASKPMRTCVYAPDAAMLVKARNRILTMLLRHDDVDLYMVRNLPDALASIRAGRPVATLNKLRTMELS